MRVMVGLTPADLRHRHDRRPAGSPTCPTPAARSASSSTPPPSTPAAPAARSSPSPSAPWACPAAAVDEMLERVSLTADRGASAGCGNYSLGMRQRLGIATALHRRPDVLILDEPANGLDPAGIRWMRDLLRGYADRGGTVLLSSHLLHEIEVIADDLVVIGNGRIVAQRHEGRAARRRRHPGRAPATSPRPRPRARRRPASARHARSTAACAPTPTPTLVGQGRPRRRRRPHRAARRRRRRPGGDVPRAHRRHPARRRRTTNGAAA